MTPFAGLQHELLALQFCDPWRQRVLQLGRADARWLLPRPRAHRPLPRAHPRRLQPGLPAGLHASHPDLVRTWSAHLTRSATFDPFDTALRLKRRLRPHRPLPTLLPHSWDPRHRSACRILTRCTNSPLRAIPTWVGRQTTLVAGAHARRRSTLSVCLPSSKKPSWLTSYAWLAPITSTSAFGRTTTHVSSRLFRHSDRARARVRLLRLFPVLHQTLSRLVRLQTAPNPNSTWTRTRSPHSTRLGSKPMPHDTVHTTASCGDRLSATLPPQPGTRACARGQRSSAPWNARWAESTEPLTGPSLRRSKMYLCSAFFVSYPYSHGLQHHSLFSAPDEGGSAAFKGKFCSVRELPRRVVQS